MAADHLRRAAFLNSIRQYVETDPESAAFIADYAQAGLRAALQQSRELATDMEIALSVLATRRYKGADELVRSKIAKWEGKTAMKWDWLLHPADKEST